jgi:hypothetical protein
MQGKTIPKYLGHFTLKFHERELDDDRIFNVLMMEVVDGILLHKLPTKRLLPAERKFIADSALELAREVHEAGIFGGGSEWRHRPRESRSNWRNDYWIAIKV